jgi:hypothetical protein
MTSGQDLIQPGDRVQVRLKAETFGQDGWFGGAVVRIDPYSAHRSFYWVELDSESQAILGGGLKLISVLNPKNIRKV